MTEEILRRPAVEQATGLPRSTIYRKMAADPPEFPKPVRLGPKSVGWLRSEIEAFISARIAERDTPTTSPA